MVCSEPLFLLLVVVVFDFSKDGPCFQFFLLLKRDRFLVFTRRLPLVVLLHSPLPSNSFVLEP